MLVSPFFGVMDRGPVFNYAAHDATKCDSLCPNTCLSDPKLKYLAMWATVLNFVLMNLFFLLMTHYLNSKLPLLSSGRRLIHVAVSLFPVHPSFTDHHIPSTRAPLHPITLIPTFFSHSHSSLFHVSSRSPVDNEKAFITFLGFPSLSPPDV